MNSSSQTPKEILRSMQIITAALCAGVVVFAAISVYISSQDGAERIADAKEYENIFPLLAGIFSAIGLIAGWTIYRKKIDLAKESIIPLGSKLIMYRTALIAYLALTEGPALLAIVLFFLSGNYILLVIGGAMLLSMLLKFPSVKRVSEELGLDYKDQQQLL